MFGELVVKCVKHGSCGHGGSDGDGWTRHVNLCVGSRLAWRVKESRASADVAVEGWRRLRNYRSTAWLLGAARHVCSTLFATARPPFL
eukprot:scaffold8340_cov91-Skeletonema_dohrnii-CCMP3373.AAC.6